MFGFDSALALFAIAMGFAFIIFVHELGHFLVAKAVGVKVMQFAIGFGPAVCSYRKGLGFRMGGTEAEYERIMSADGKPAEASDPQPSSVAAPSSAEEAAAPAPAKPATALTVSQPPVDPAMVSETEYRVNWFPLGGYVRMLGQDDLDPSAASQDARAFNNKPIWARALVVIAGVVMNLIFGTIFFIVAFMAGVDFPPAEVGDVLEGSPAATTMPVGHGGDEQDRGLQPGDQITHVDGKEITDFMDLAIATALAGPGQDLNLVVERPGRDAPLMYAIEPVVNPQTGLLSLGVASPLSLTLPDTLGRMPDALTDAGVTGGMTLAAINGEPIERHFAYRQRVRSSRGAPLDLTFTAPDGRTVEATVAARAGLTVQTDLKQGEMSLPNLLGLVPGAVVIDVQPESPAETAGLRTGDLIARINAQPWPDAQSLRQTIQASGSREVRLTVLRDGELVDLAPVRPQRQKGAYVLGFRFDFADVPVVAEVLPERAASDLGLVAGSRILALDGQPIERFSDLQRILQDMHESRPEGGPIEIRYELNIATQPVETATLSLTDADLQEISQAAWFLPMDLQMLRIPVAADDPVAATLLGIHKSHQFMLQTYITMARLFQGTVPANQLRGPIGIIDEGVRVAHQGWAYLIFFLGLISVNLVVINLLPIPIVDGGLLVFLLVEKIKGSPVSVQVQTAATVVGLVLIGSIFLMTFVFDIMRFIS